MRLSPKPSNLAITCLPLPLFQAVCNEVTAITQAPYELVLAGALSAISVACQGVINVMPPGGQARPVSLAVIAITDSGERKSTVVGALFSPIRTFEERCREKFAEELRDYNERLALWELRHHALMREIRWLIRHGEDATNAEDNLLEYTGGPGLLFLVRLDLFTKTLRCRLYCLACIMGRQL